MLGGMMSMFFEPLQPTRENDLIDESIGSFVARRMDKRLADNLISAVFHGIYAGDINQLSARTLLSLGWNLEGRFGSALGGHFQLQGQEASSKMITLAHPLDVESANAFNAEIDLDIDFAKNLREAAMFTFEDGLQTLVKSLQDAVEMKGNVEIRTSAPVQSFKPIKDELGVEVISGVRLPPSPTNSPFTR